MNETKVSRSELFNRFRRGFSPKPNTPPIREILKDRNSTHGPFQAPVGRRKALKVIAVGTAVVAAPNLVGCEGGQDSKLDPRIQVSHVVFADPENDVSYEQRVLVDSAETKEHYDKWGHPGPDSGAFTIRYQFNTTRGRSVDHGLLEHGLDSSDPDARTDRHSLKMEYDGEIQALAGFWGEDGVRPAQVYFGNRISSMNELNLEETRDLGHNNLGIELNSIEENEETGEISITVTLYDSQTQKEHTASISLGSIHGFGYFGEKLYVHCLKAEPESGRVKIAIYDDLTMLTDGQELADGTKVTIQTGNFESTPTLESIDIWVPVF